MFIALLEDSMTPDHGMFTSPGVMITGALIIFLARLCCWKMCCQSTNSNQVPAYLASLASLASPAPMVFNMSQDPI